MNRSIKLSLLALIGSLLWGQVNPGPGRPFVPKQNAGTDVICAKGSDTITGLTCNNTADGTAETAFSTTVSILPKSLASGAVPVSLLFGWVTSSSPPSITIKIRLGGIGGTLIYQTTAGVTSTASVSYRTTEVPCRITAIGAATTTTPTQTGCISIATGGGLFTNSVPTSSTLTTAVNATIAQTVTVTVTWASNTAGNAIYLYGIAPL